MDSKTGSLFHFIENDPIHRIVKKNADEGKKIRQPLVLFWILAISYVPVLLITILEGTFYKGVTISFVRDFALQFRFLIAVPMLVFSRPVIQEATTKTCEYIHNVLLDKEENERVFLPAISRIREFNASWKSMSLVLFLVMVSTAGIYYFSVHEPGLVAISGWYGKVSDGVFYDSKAFLWFNIVSMLIFRFLLLRWFMSYCSWIWLLVKVSGCHLKLTPHHGDKACGLNMLVYPQTRFNIFFVAMAITSSGMIINDIIYRGAVFESVIPQIAAIIGISFLMLLGPYLFFVSKLFAAKKQIHIAMSKKSQQLSEDYEREWIETHVTGSNEEKPDPSVMIDFFSTFEIAEKIRPFAFNLQDLIVLAVPIALSFLPTLLTRMSIKEILEVGLRFLV